MKILFIRFSSLGDIILTTPCLTLLKESFPSAEIFFATKSDFVEILKENKNIKEIICLNKKESLYSFVKKLRSHNKRKFDLVVDLHNSLRSRLICIVVAKNKVVRYKKPYLKRWLLVYRKINLLPKNFSVALQYMKTCECVGVHPRSIPPTVFYRSSPKTKKILSLVQNNHKIIAIAPGSRWYTKTWPLNNFLIVTDMLLQQTDNNMNYTIIFLGSHQEKKPLSKTIENHFLHQMNKQVFNLIGQLSLAETFYIIKISNLLLCNDSGLMHAASAFNTKILPLFLSTVPEFGFVPIGLQPNDIMSKPLQCKPCNHKGLKKCPKKHFLCAWLIQPKDVITKIKRLLQK